LAAEALVLGLQVTEASLKGLAAGTQDGLHTCIIREAGPQLRRPRPQDRDQRELHPLNKYTGTCGVALLAAAALMGSPSEARRFAGDGSPPSARCAAVYRQQLLGHQRAQLRRTDIVVIARRRTAASPRPRSATGARASRS
jgi:hypothetical protein